MNGPKIYISGPITGQDIEIARSRFEAAEELIREEGFEPVNPMKLDHNHNGSWVEYMRVDIKALCDCEGIYMLEGWSSSEGAKTELDLAIKLRMHVHFEI